MRGFAVPPAALHARSAIFQCAAGARARGRRVRSVQSPCAASCLRACASHAQVASSRFHEPWAMCSTTASVLPIDTREKSKNRYKRQTLISTDPTHRYTIVAVHPLPPLFLSRRIISFDFAPFSALRLTPPPPSFFRRLFGELRAEDCSFPV